MELEAIIKLLGGVRATVFAGIALILLGAFGVQSWRLNTRTGERDKLHADSVLWQQANRDNMKAIGELRTANDAWANAAEQVKGRSVQAIAAVDAERNRLQGELADLRRERGTIYATDPDAAAWGRARVPARIADQLRR